MKYSLAVHGGAGLSTRNLTSQEESAYLEAIRETLELGRSMLESGASALDVAQATIVMMEDEPMFNAGRGSVLNHEGFAECDASLMEGTRCRYGGVAGSTRLKNPVLGARYVMDQTPHLLLCGSGADALPLEKADPDYFLTERRREQLEKARAADRVTLDHESTGTVGAVVLDRSGHLAAGSSTGGMTNKMVGRVGDSPIIGAALFADDRTCAVTCTGRGESFLGRLIAHRISNLIEFGGLDLEAAVDECFQNHLKSGDGGLLALDRSGTVLMPFNTAGMIRGAVNSEGRFELAIW